MPRQFRPYVSKNTLDLSAASDFYKKKAAVVERLTNYVELAKESTYKLKGGFEDWFFASLPTVNSLESPPNALAEALFYLGIYWAKIEYGHLPRDPCAGRISDDVVNEQWKETWKGMEPRDCEAFRMNPTLSEWIGYAIGESGALDAESWHEPTSPRVKLGVSFSKNLQLPPRMSITVLGDPVIAFIVAYVRKSLRAARNRKKELRSAIVLFDAISHAIKRDFLGLVQAGKGRPRELGELAAYRIHHENKKVRAVSRELCIKREQEPNHRCDGHCYDRIRKACEGYYRHLGRDLQALISVKTEKTR